MLETLLERSPSGSSTPGKSEGYEYHPRVRRFSLLKILAELWLLGSLPLAGSAVYSCVRYTTIPSITNPVRSDYRERFIE